VIADDADINRPGMTKLRDDAESVPRVDSNLRSTHVFMSGGDGE
jgi:hypothetical protein